MIAVENRARTHHVRPRLRARHNSCAVRQVHDPGIDSQSAQPVQRRVEAFFLLPRLPANRGVRKHFRRSKVRKDPGELKVFALRQLPRKAFHVPGRDAQAVHSRVDFHVERNRLPSALAGRRALQQRQLLAAMNRRRKIMLHQARFFSRHEARENQDGLSHPRLAHRNAFVRTGDAEPVRAAFFQRLGYFRAAMAVAIAFDNRKDFPRRFAFLLGRIDVVSDRPEILLQRRKRHFCPHRASHFLTLLNGCHALSEKNSLRHSRGVRRQPLWLPRE